VIVLAALGKARLFVLVGSALLIGGGMLFCRAFAANGLKEEWLLCIELGVIPLLSGCLGLFLLKRSRKQKLSTSVSDQVQEKPTGIE
jgi:uncharacterized membrane protein HdeD (DUF308 family)